MDCLNWDKIQEHEVLEGLFGKFFHSETMTIVRWRFDVNTDLPIHNHPHEQITMIEKGKLHLKVDDVSKIILPGDIVTIKSNVKHGGKALEDTIAIDIFHPIREDFKEKYA